MKPITFSVILLAAVAIIGFGYSNRHVAVSQNLSHQRQIVQPASLLVSAPTVLNDSGKKRGVAIPVPPTIPASSITSVDSSMAVDSSSDMPDAPYDPTAELAPDELRVYKIMDTSAMAMFQRHDTIKVMSEMMSRCPSGYQYYVSDTNTAATLRYGSVQYYRGCDGKEVCKFKVNVLTGVVMLKPKRSKEYLTVREFERKHWGKAS